MKASPYYKEKWNNSAHYYRKDFWILKKEGSREIELLEKFGFTITENNISAPDLETFIIKYQEYLDYQKIPQDSRIMPALSIAKKEDQSVKLHNPLTPWKGSLNEWTPKIGLHLKGRQVTEGLAQGLFPIFTNGYHDIFHFITFALYPSYTKKLIEKNKAIAKLKLNKSILNRSAYALEALTLADSNKISEIRDSITIKKLNSKTTFYDFHNEVSLLSDEELQTKVEFWKLNFKKFLTHYSGGMAEPVENSIYRDMINNGKIQYITSHFSETYKSRSYDKIMPNEILYDGMTYMDAALSKISESTEDELSKIFNNVGENSNPTKNELLKLQIARMEYALWKSATEINQEVWINDTMKESVDLESSTMLFIKDCFGVNSAIYQLFK